MADKTADQVAPNVRRCDCGETKQWRECDHCEDGFVDHDCGEDCCCCLDPEPNVVCEICDGESGWFQCFSCHPMLEE